MNFVSSQCNPIHYYRPSCCIEVAPNPTPANRKIRIHGTNRLPSNSPDWAESNVWGILKEKHELWWLRRDSDIVNNQSKIRQIFTQMSREFRQFSSNLREKSPKFPTHLRENSTKFRLTIGNIAITFNSLRVLNV